MPLRKEGFTETPFNVAESTVTKMTAMKRQALPVNMTNSLFTLAVNMMAWLHLCHYTFIFQTLLVTDKLLINLYYPDEDLYYGMKYWVFLLNRSKYIFGFSFVVWRWFFFTLLSHTSTPVSRFRYTSSTSFSAIH